MVSPLPRVALLLSLLFTGARGLRAEPEVSSAPVNVPRATQHDFVSTINRRPYRIFVSEPMEAAPGKTFPVFYILDGNWYFLAAAENIAEAARQLSPAIVVGVGFPTDDRGEIARRRTFDLSLPVAAGGAARSEANTMGGADDFIRVLLEEIKPLVEARHPVDRARQTLYGKSLGGTTTLRTMFRHPEAFQTYVAASPSVYRWLDPLRADEAAFATRAKSGEISLRLLITAAGNEQYRGPDPKLLAEAQRTRFVDHALELAARLAALNPEKFPVHHAVITDEDHVSVSLAALGRALRFSLPPAPAR